MRSSALVAVTTIHLIADLGTCAAAEPVFLREPSESQQKREGIVLFIAADGRLFSDSGPTNERSLRETFQRWRAEGTEPGIRLVLYPALESNSNLKSVRRIIDFLRAHRVGYDIMLQPIDAVPDKDL